MCDSSDHIPQLSLFAVLNDKVQNEFDQKLAHMKWHPTVIKISGQKTMLFVDKLFYRI